MMLESLGIPSLPQSLDGVRVPQKVGENSLSDSGSLRRLSDDLPTPYSIEGKESILRARSSSPAIPCGPLLGSRHGHRRCIERVFSSPGS